MSRPLFDSEYLYGIHDPGGESLMLDAMRPGWILFREEIGHDPADKSSRDFSSYADRGLGIMCLLTHGCEPNGTIPHSSMYEEFAQRVAAFVANSAGCKIWIIGNEMNYAVERPGVNIDWSRHPSVQGATPEESDPLRHGLAIRFNVLPDYSTEIRTTRGAMVSPGEVITPAMYARCYRLCRDAIHRIPGHEDDQVLVGGVAPWNTQTIYSGNANGDWVLYFRDILMELGPSHCDGFCIHTYTHGADPGFIASEELLPAPFQDCHQHFRTYRDFLNVVPATMRELPVYITETDQSEPWLDRNVGWIQTAYAEIDAWNQQPGNQQIRALVLYRWSKSDRWHLQERTGILEDFRDALAVGYRWQGEESRDDDVAKEAEGDKRDTTPARRAEWVNCTLPRRMVAGQTAMIQLTLRNGGREAWEPSSNSGYTVHYAYYRNRRRLSLGTEEEAGGTISSSIAHGESTGVDVRIKLPDQPGNYTLEFDLVAPDGTSFKELGSPVLTRWVTVEAPSRPASDGSNGDSNTLPVPLFADLSSSLPRASIPYAQRDIKQVRYIVLSHTAANPRVSLERIAQTHIRYGYPGIAYDFVVDNIGQVFKVSELQEVAQPNQVWSEQGVNVCLAGNFNEDSPPMAQLDATGRLCAWLAQNLGLTPDAILGLGELTRTDSPGRSFYKGPSWKDVVSRQVRLHLAAISGAGDSGRMVELNQTIEDLQSRNLTLREQLEDVSHLRRQLDDERARLSSEITRLHKELATQAVEFVGGIRVQPCYDTLPRDAERYQARPESTVRYIVVSHTGVHPDTDLKELARAHRPDWPGVLFDYLVTINGEIYQTQPLEEVVDTDEEYLKHAIGVAFAGNFDADIPPDKQLRAGAKLIAWLLETFPNVDIEQIQGVCEFIEHNSPGRQWLEGAQWKDRLLGAVRSAQGTEGSPVVPSVIEQQLRTEIIQIERRLVEVQDSLYAVEEQRSKLEHDNFRLQTQLRDRQDEPGVYVVPQPAMRVEVDRLPQHPTLRYDRRSLAQITHIAIHHTATPVTMGPERIADLHVASDSSRGKDAWPGIGYHFFVHSDGTIDQTNYLETASFHVFRHNTYSVGIVFAGSFMNGRIPTSAQLRAGAHLVAWLMQELNIPLARVWGHREFPDNSTVCPGSEWTLGNRWRDLLFERIEQVQSGIGVKSIRHYMLFWQRPFPGPLARQDFVNAINYVVRFRPTVGFSLQDAKNAEYVTIVGNEAGISASDEKMLRDSGCKVERIAGRNEEETSRILSELASEGRRFRSTAVDF